MSLRLDSVFAHIKNARKDLAPGRVIDVGSDHGHTAISCLDDDVALSAVCTDINEGPARICRNNLDEAGYQDRAEVVVTDGLDGVSLKENDIVVISGLGGLNTVDILRRVLAKEDLPPKESLALVLQPQKSIEDLRRFLREEGFHIKDETPLLDSGFHYVVLTAVWEGALDCPDLSDMEYAYFGPVLLGKIKEKDPDTEEYYGYLRRILSVRGRSDPACTEALDILEKILN